MSHIRVARTGILRAAELRRKKTMEHGFGARHIYLYDREKIKELLTKGLSINKVARIIGCSGGPVQAVRKELVKLGIVNRRVKNVTSTKTSKTKQAFWLPVGTRQNNLSSGIDFDQPKFICGSCGQIYSKAMETKK